MHANRFSRFRVCLAVALAIGHAEFSISARANAQVVISSPNPITSGEFGAAIASVPDEDDDGYADIVVGAPRETLQNTEVGRAYLASGRTGMILRTFVPPANVPFLHFGTAVAGVRDFDSDGYPDIAIGAPGDSSIGICICSGRTGALLLQKQSPGGSGFGGAILSIGDVTNDGVPDLIVSANSSNDRVFLLSGQNLAVQRIFFPTVEGTGGFGTALSLVPDVNGDGKPDLLIGAPLTEWSGSPNDAGVAYIFSLTGNAPLAVFYAPTPVQYGHFGAGVAGLPDQDGDGKGDVLIGSPNEGNLTPGSFDDRGAAHVISSASLAVLRTLLPVSDSSSEQRNFGQSALVVPDRNGDGIADWVVGAPYESRVYVFSGATAECLETYRSERSGTNGLGVNLTFLPNPAGGEIAAGSPANLSAIWGGRALIFLTDCNTNMIRDSIELATGQARDCNDDGIPDECNANGYQADCNLNGSWDACDLYLGESQDVDANGIPDECAIPHCSGPATCAQSPRQSTDCNSNGLSDECETSLRIIARASENSSGAAGSAADSGLAMSEDARFVAFYSTAPALVPGDWNGFCNVFVKDLASEAVENIHVASDGASADGDAFATIAMSRDGRYVAYASNATNLVPGASGTQLYVFDRVTRSTSLVSADADGIPGNNYSVAPAFSADARFVAFWSNATNLTPNDTNGRPDVFRKNRETGEIMLVSIRADGQPGNDSSGARRSGGNYFVTSNQVAISDEGRYVAFGSDASNLVNQDSNGVRDVFVHDCQLHTTWRVNLAPGGVDANRASAGYANPWTFGGAISMSGDGRFVAFDSLASNLAPGDTNNRVDLFIHDRLMNSIARIAPVGTSTAPLIANPRISSDGCRLVFSANLDGLIPGQPASGDILFSNIYVYDRTAASYKLVSSNPAGVMVDATTGESIAITPDAYTVAFTSAAQNLVIAPSAGATHAYVRSLLAASDCNGNHVPDVCEVTCHGDGNGDGVVRGDDIQAWEACMLNGCSGSGCASFDFDGDSALTDNDLALFVERLMESPDTACPRVSQ